MSKKLLIVHGYSDGSTSFKGLGNYFISQNVYARDDVYYVDYASMDDQATFRDFADKLESEYRRLQKDGKIGPGERIDVACHSTGSLVTRAWLVLHRERARQLDGKDSPCPVDRLLMFAPANFGSDLAGLGQSVLGRIRSTFNKNSRKGQYLESGRHVLQGLEPASPFQWSLSAIDLHSEETYFKRTDDEAYSCYPFVFAAGQGYTGWETQVVKSRKKPGTDGTVRICGTSLNTRKCTIEFVPDDGLVPHDEHEKAHLSLGQLTWHPEHKFGQVPFAVFKGLNHGSVVNPKSKAFKERVGPLAVKVLNKVKSSGTYKAVLPEFKAATEQSYSALKGAAKDRYQQFFFRVRDDVDLKVDDWFMDFSVWTPTKSSGGKTTWKRHTKLTTKFDREFESQFYPHSADTACRALMLNCTSLETFVAALAAAKSTLILNISARSNVRGVRYRRGQFFVADGSGLFPRKDKFSFMYPNTTTLVDVILDRLQPDSMLVVCPDAAIE
jgi:pimeloyl-ACP methyl ester carboxylesterase